MASSLFRAEARLRETQNLISDARGAHTRRRETAQAKLVRIREALATIRNKAEAMIRAKEDAQIRLSAPLGRQVQGLTEEEQLRVGAETADDIAQVKAANETLARYENERIDLELDHLQQEKILDQKLDLSDLEAQLKQREEAVEAAKQRLNAHIRRAKAKGWEWEKRSLIKVEPEPQETIGARQAHLRELFDRVNSSPFPE